MTEPARGVGRALRASFEGVRGRLLALVLAGAIPVVGVVLGNALSEYRDSLDEVGRAATLLREAGAARQAAAMETFETVLRGLAGDDRLLRSPPEACEAALRDILGIFSQRFTGLWVLDAEGRLHCSTAPVQRGRSFAEQDYFAAVTAGGGFGVGGFTSGPITGVPVLQAAATVTRDGRPVSFVGAAIRLDWLARRSRHEAETPHDAWLFDSAGRSLPVGGADPGALPPPAEMGRLLSEAGGQVVTGVSVGGTRTVWSGASLGHGLRYAVALRAEGAASQARMRLYRRLAELWLFVLASVLAILAGAELTCSRPLRRLARSVQHWRPGAPLRIQPSAWDPWEVRSLNTTLSDASGAVETKQGELAAALRQRDVMLEEIHHRVKNNLQVVASLLNLQAGRASDGTVRQELLVARERVQALAALHRHLTVEGNVAVVPLEPLLREMCGPFVQALRADGGLDVTVEAQPLTLRAEQAASFALFVAEALTNAVRHAFPGNRPGRVAVRMVTEGEEALLEIADDGVGMAKEATASETVGLSLMRGFAAHLEGEFDVVGEGEGTVVRLRFPVAETL